jgi:hypothetical protein
MSTNYSLSDRLPRDSAGQPLLAGINDQTSQLDFSLIRMVGTSSTGSKNLGYLGTAGTTQGSKLESLHPLMQVGGVYLTPVATETSAVAPGRAKIAQVSAFGELLSVPHPATYGTLTAGSTQTFKAGASGIVRGYGVSWSGVNLGDSVSFSDGTTFISAIVFTSAAGYADRVLPNGGVMATSITLRRVGLTGQSSAVVFYL